MERAFKKSKFDWFKEAKRDLDMHMKEMQNALKNTRENILRHNHTQE